MEKSITRSKFITGIPNFSKLIASLIRVRELIVDKATVTQQIVGEQGVQTQTFEGPYIANTTLDSQAGANGLTFDTSNLSVVWDPDGAARTGMILTVPISDGQNFFFTNIGAAGETVTFDVSGTSNVAAGTSAVIDGGFASHFISYNGLWYIMN